VNLRPRRPEPPAVDLTPLIDVVFLLLIFFMVSASFERRVALPLRLPVASVPARAADPREPLHLRIDRVCRARLVEGTFENILPGCAAGAPASGAEVRAAEHALTAALVAARGPDERALTIEADALTPHGAVVQALAAARAAGFARVMFAAVVP